MMVLICIPLLSSLHAPHADKDCGTPGRSSAYLIVEVAVKEVGAVCCIVVGILEFLKIDRLGHGRCEVSGAKCSRMAPACCLEEDENNDGDATGGSENVGNGAVVIGVVLVPPHFESLDTAMASMYERVSACFKAAKSIDANEEEGRHGCKQRCLRQANGQNVAGQSD